ncbi:rhomboid-related protein 4 [Rhipicephalus microplus]|uniref:rhomboid-related protein 4 n=1 Tax=Rhipicephalus microplus TaxID=6941 RepID=UPI003F6AF2A9
MYLGLFSLPWFKPEEARISVTNALFTGEWPRIFYGVIKHGNSLHLYYNMVSFIWKGINLEEKMHTVPFFCVVCLFTALTGVFKVSLNYFLVTHVDAIFYKRCIFGFSGAIFEIKLLDNVKYPAQSRNIFGITVALPSGYAVWLGLLLVQLVAGNNCPFAGHLAGVLAGFVYLGVIRPIVYT